MTQASNVGVLTPKINSSGQLDATTGLTGAVPVANGGTGGTASPTTNGVAYGNGTAVAYTAAGTTGQVLTATTSGAPTWAAASGGGGSSALNYGSGSSPLVYANLGSAPRNQNPTGFGIGGQASYDTYTNGYNGTAGIVVFEY